MALGDLAALLGRSRVRESGTVRRTPGRFADVSTKDLVDGVGELALRLLEDSPSFREDARKRRERLEEGGLGRELAVDDVDELLVGHGGICFTVRAAASGRSCTDTCEQV